MLLWICIVVAALQVLAYLVLAYGWRRVAPPPAADAALPLTVLIAAHNEAANLPVTLPAVLAQDHPDFEVLVVLDRCTDGSADIVRGLQAQHPHLRYLAIDAVPEGWAPKKYALQQGIAAARHEHLALTDADCQPAAGWLAGIDRQFQSGKSLVLGLSPYRACPGLLNLLIRHETAQTALQFIGLAALGLPYMGLGRNIAYTKTFFKEAGGFTAVSARLSGDDDLLVNHAAVPATTGLMIAPETVTWSEPKQRFGAWIRQKLRHASAGPAYNLRSKLILAGFHGLQVIFYVSWGAVLFNDPTGQWSGGIYGIRTLLLMGILAQTDACARDWKLTLAFPLLDLGYLLYNLLLVPAGWIMKPKWGGK